MPSGLPATCRAFSEYLASMASSSFCCRERSDSRSWPKAPAPQKRHNTATRQARANRAARPWLMNASNILTPPWATRRTHGPGTRPRRISRRPRGSTVHPRSCREE
ncbi:hypothetical protein [Desulfomicrobium sp. ZS1]|uniref:hypothetical protein n=1 Tax=Desulfomicrobium sp. ZS1 TaxID=2952228 RepID=UPI003530EEAD